MTKKIVLVTGGAGFIGKHTVRLLNKEGFNVVVADRKSPKEGANDLICKYYQVDVATEDFETIFKENKIDYVIHLAALPSVADSIRMPLVDCHDNYQATVNVCTIAKKYEVKKIIFSSTAAVYANPQYLPVDEKHPTSYLSPYAITKNAAENYIKYCGIDYIIFRYANVYGVGQDCFGEAGVVAKFFDLMSQNKPIQIQGNGKQYRDFIYVEDVAIANVLSLKTDIQDEIINVSTNSRTSINDLFEIMKEELNYKLKPKYTAPREGDIEKSILNNGKLISMLHFAPSIDTRTGIREMVKHFSETGKVCA
jgi:UDP-glucose 4-epimerase